MHKCRLLNSFEDHGGWFSLNSTKKQHRYLLFSPSLGNCLKYKSAQAGGGINRFSTSLALRNGLVTYFKVAVDRLVTSSKKVSPEFANNRKTLRRTLLYPIRICIFFLRHLFEKYFIWSLFRNLEM